MSFTKYASIENAYRKRFIDKIVEEGHSSGKFVVEEKIHGANFSFWMTHDSVRVAKRTAMIGDGEGFFNYEDVYDKYVESMKTLFFLIRDQYDGSAEEITVYGELYGGGYNHPDVVRTHHKNFQKEVQYRPDQDFIAFDVKINGRYIPVAEVHGLLDAVQIPYVKTLFTGTLQECLDYKNEFPTTIPVLLGLPEIEGNVCEGVVIKPAEPIFLWSGERLIIKNKNDKFKEKHGDKSTGKTPRPVKEIAPELLAMVEEARQFINENRLRNVISKVGEISNKDFGKLMGLFTKDIIEDFMKDNDAFLAMGKSDRAVVTKRIGQDAALLLRQNFVNILDGEF